MANKKVLKSMLFELSTPEERKAFKENEIEGLGDRIEELSNMVSGVTERAEDAATKQQMQELNFSLRKFKVEFANFVNKLADSLEGNNDSIIKGFTKLADTLKDSKPKDYSGFFKDFPTLLSQIGGNTKDTSELIRNLKWNASQQLRDVNGSPINPAIAGFGITSTYDDIQLTYTGSNLTQVNYYAQGALKARLVLTYSGSNLIEVQRTI